MPSPLVVTSQYEYEKKLDRNNEHDIYKIIMKKFLIWTSSEPHDSFLPYKGQENSILLNNMDMSFSKLGDMMNWLRFCLFPYDNDSFCW